MSNNPEERTELVCRICGGSVDFNNLLLMSGKQVRPCNASTRDTHTRPIIQAKVHYGCWQDVTEDIANTTVIDGEDF